MRYEERDDSELLEFARAGWRPAFAVLVHRHAPALLTAFADEPDPAERALDVLVRAMRELPDHGGIEPVAAWLFTLAGRPVPDRVEPVPQGTLDELWRELDLRWPDGKRSHRPGRPALRRLATVVGALALGVAVPTIVLGLPASAPDEPAEAVRAQPLEDDPSEPPEVEQDLPSFEFPDIESGAGTTDTAPQVDDDASVPTTDPDPAPDAGSEPAVIDEPVEPEPEPELPDPPLDPGTDDGVEDDGTDGTDGTEGTEGTDGVTDGDATDDGATDGGGGGAVDGGTDGGVVDGGTDGDGADGSSGGGSDGDGTTDDGAVLPGGTP